MKIDALKNYVGKVKDFYFPKSVEIVQYPIKGIAEDALYKLEPAKDVFESYAKHNCVSLFIDKASTLIDNEKLIKPELKEHLQNSIMMRVINKISGKERVAILDASKDTFTHTSTSHIDVQSKDGAKTPIIMVSSHEDDFVRATYRLFENLTKLVQK